MELGPNWQKLRASARLRGQEDVSAAPVPFAADQFKIFGEPTLTPGAAGNAQRPLQDCHPIEGEFPLGQGQHATREFYAFAIFAQCREYRHLICCTGPSASHASLN